MEKATEVVYEYYKGAFALKRRKGGFEAGLIGGGFSAINQNADIFDDFWQRRTQTYYTYFKREFDKRRENCGVLAGSNAIACGYALR